MNGAALPVLAFLLLHFIVGLVPFARGGVQPLLYGVLHSAGAEAARRLDREARTAGALFLRGAIVTALFAAGTLVLGGIVQSLRHGPYGWAAHVVFLACACTAMAPLYLVQKTAKALGAKDEAAARLLLQPYARENLEQADAFTLARKTAEVSAFSLNVFLTGPLFWYALLGAQGAALFVAFAAMRASFGNGFFGMASRFPDEVLKFVPALVTSVGIAVASVFAARAHPAGALAAALSRGAKEGADIRPLAALAGALDVTLGGPPLPWVGPKDSSAKVMPDVLDRCAMLHFIFFLCVMVAVSAVVLGINFFKNMTM